MKCHSCGYELHIEDEKCPHCGKANPYYQKHRADMGKYEQDFSAVKQDVYKKTGFFTGLTVKITMIAVLVALELSVLVFHHYSWDIRRAWYENKAEKHVEEYTEKLDELEQSGRYIEFAIFYETNRLHSCDAYAEYRKVQRMCDSYRTVYHDFMQLNVEDSFVTTEEKMVQLCDDLERLYEASERKEYDAAECFGEQHMQAMEDMLEDVKAFLVTYAGLTKEEAENFSNLSNARKQLALEGGLGLDEN